jgi:hypothetical protein
LLMKTEIPNVGRPPMMIRDSEIRIKSVCLRVSGQANQKKGDAGRISLFHASAEQLSLGASARPAVPSALALTGL